ncbi:hypothetical protein PCYB_041570 [Plasmodium cynomolgi strain B]|uniref:Uncharacterized protein n=1 Tax=Plasmodium cynomolgi (strain B) TaxID=1120755 RepID=K6USL0_PLACD|nr:hypothetical protein PCYB_041570 [Plasmodium cynomolgi strain B]GAB64955.1 hypothetical protein PCYB_041570 [Plasmodium cynomolgi strain B]
MTYLWRRTFLRPAWYWRDINRALLSGEKKERFMSYFQQKREDIKETEESYNLEEAFLRRISKMNNSALAHTCEDINRRKMNNHYMWELVHVRVRAIRNSFNGDELVVMLHAYCNSLSFDPNFTDLVNLFWDLLEEKLENLDYLSHIALYYCAEKTKNEKKMDQITALLQNALLKNGSPQMKLTERGLQIILKIFCKNEKIVVQKEHITAVGELIQKVDVKEVRNVFSFDEPFLAILKKIQELLIFKKINPCTVLKCLSVTPKLCNDNAAALQGVRSTLCVAHLAQRIRAGR